MESLQNGSRHPDHQDDSSKVGKTVDLQYRKKGDKKGKEQTNLQASEKEEERKTKIKVYKAAFDQFSHTKLNPGWND